MAHKLDHIKDEIEMVAEMLAAQEHDQTKKVLIKRLTKLIKKRELVMKVHPELIKRII
jgi:glucuronate isomerase